MTFPKYLIISFYIGAIASVLVLLADADVDSSADASTLSSNEFYVAPYGSPTADGSLADPWDLQTALNHPAAVQPGDIIWLREGRYGTGGKILSYLTGTEENPIIVRQYPGERATVNGGIEATRDGAWVTFWGFEITNTNPRVVSTEDIETLRPEGLGFHGRGYKAINMIIHDTGHPGIGFWSPVGDGGEIYGCLIWGTGIYENGSSERGSAIYAQNQEGTRYIADVIAFWNFFAGIKPGAVGGWTDGFVLEGNVGFNNYRWPLFHGGSESHPASRSVATNNYTYHEPREDWGTGNLFGWSRDVYQGDAEIRDNYFVGGVPSLEIRNWRELTVTGNTVIGATQAVIHLEDPDNITDAYWDYNTYFGGTDVAEPFQYQHHTNTYDFAGWQSVTGFDANSTFTPSLPTEPKIVVRPNKYEPGRGHVIVYNWDLQDTVSVDVSSILDIGDAYQVQDAQHFFGEPVAAGIYDGDPLTLPMNLTKKTALFGAVTHFDRHERHTAPEFAVFVLLPDSSIQPYLPHPDYLPTIFKSR